MTKRTLITVLVVAVAAVFVTVVIASSIGGDSSTPTHMMPGGQNMQDGGMGGQGMDGQNME